MGYESGLNAPNDAELMANVGVIADRLVAACTPEGSLGDTRILLERALVVAAEAQQLIAEQRRRIDQLEALSFKDELTGLYNRRAFDEHLRRAFAVADRHGTTGVVAFIDLDDFKAVNDRLGHPAGDAVLRHIAVLLRKNLRATDFVARLGGDEFAAVLEHTDAAGGQQRALAIERLLNAAVIRHGRLRIVVRASIGAAAFGPGDDAEAVLTLADERMYQAKRARLAPPHLRRTA